MSTLSEVLAATKKILLVTDDIKRLSADSQALSDKVADHEVDVPNEVLDRPKSPDEGMVASDSTPSVEDQLSGFVPDQRMAAPDSTSSVEDPLSGFVPHKVAADQVEGAMARLL